MNAEFFAALEQLEKEKGIPVDYMLDRVCQALLTAYKKDNDGLKCDNVYVEPDMDEKTIHMYVAKEVVDEAEDPLTEISLEDAKKISPRVSLGDTVRVDVQTRKFGRIAAQAAKQVIIQGIRESERGIVDIETLKHTNESLISTLDEVMKIQTEGRAKRAAAESELQSMENELKAKLLEIRA